MMTIGNQRRAADPASNANAKDRDCFVTKKTDP
jgi:hypothetical protein